jgi:protein-tyrosine phosphatase
MRIDYVEAFFLEDNQNELNIVTDIEDICKYQLYWTYERNALTEDKEFILESDQKNQTFEFAYNTDRVNYFIIEFENHQPLLLGYRILPMSGMYNFRDIGGYRTEEGKRIKWGVGFRSDHLQNLNDDGFEFLRSIGLKSVIDFRSPFEVDKDPNPFFSEEAQAFNFDPQAHVAMAAGSAQNLDTSEDMKERALKAIASGETGAQQMIDQQLAFVDSPTSIEAFKQTLKTVAQAENIPTMQHCRGGKDRTGFALMVLEGLLGVPTSSLVYDYMLTNRARAKKNVSYYNRFLEETGNEKIAQYLYSLFDTKEEFICASIEKILTNYGTIRQYAQIVLELSDEEISALEELFLEEE